MRVNDRHPGYFETLDGGCECRYKDSQTITSVDVQSTPDGVVVSIGGELDIANARPVRERLVEAVRDYPPRMRIDLSEVSFIDSSAVGLLVAMKRRVNDYGGHFSVRCGEQALLALRMRGLLGYLNANAPG